MSARRDKGDASSIWKETAQAGRHCRPSFTLIAQAIDAGAAHPAVILTPKAILFAQVADLTS